MKIALIPIDNRPVCYTLPREIAEIDNNLELFMPDRKLLGGLTSVADVDGILDWLEGLDKVDAIVVSLDTIAYGGLVSSRRYKNSPDEIKARLEKLKEKLNGKVYAFSSIMRISNNNVNEEEKEYWNEYGKRIFEYSFNFHQFGDDKTDIPPEILHDYLATRQRNFSINKMYLEWVQQGLFETLVYSKDDCAQYGLNVLEAQILNRMIVEKKINAHKTSALIKTGADEIPLTLFARAVSDYNANDESGAGTNVLKINPKFLSPENVELLSNYEDISIENSVEAQIELAGCQIDEENPDIILLVNNFEEKQGEIVMGGKTKPFSGKIDLPKSPYMVADVRFANGADNKFVEKLLKKFEKNGFNQDFYGYSAWNTSANSLGSLICAAVVKFFAKDYNEKAFKKLQMVRFLDDWAYQANVRQILKAITKRPDVKKLKTFMAPFEKRLDKILEIKPKIKYKFPWKRFFEVEVLMGER